MGDKRLKQKQISFRLPAEMQTALELSAKKYGRSPSAEAFVRLASTFEDESWLEKVRTSPVMQIERRMLAAQSEIDQLRDEVRQLGMRLWEIEKKIS